MCLTDSFCYSAYLQRAEPQPGRRASALPPVSNPNLIQLL